MKILLLCMTCLLVAGCHTATSEHTASSASAAKPAVAAETAPDPAALRLKSEQGWRSIEQRLGPGFFQNTRRREWPNLVVYAKDVETGPPALPDSLPPLKVKAPFAVLWGGSKLIVSGAPDSVFQISGNEEIKMVSSIAYTFDPAWAERLKR